MSEPEQISFTAELHPDVAWQLAQLAKRIGFNDCYDLTEAHLSREERTQLAYQMLYGMDAVASGLRKAGVAPR